MALILLQSCGSDDALTFDEQSADFDRVLGIFLRFFQVKETEGSSQYSIPPYHTA